MFILRAYRVLSFGHTRNCYIEVTMPVRVSDYAYFLEADTLDQKYRHECDGEVISAVPIDGVGVYDLFYSRRNPDLGISVL